MGLALKKVADKSGKHPPKGMPWPLKTVRLLEEPPQRHRFTQDWLQRESLLGWVTMNGDQITLKLEDRTAVYRVKVWPGVYCLYCDERIANSPADQQNYPDPPLRKAEAERQQQHVQGCAQGEDSPDPQHPSGRQACHYYEAELEGEQSNG